MPHKMGSHGEKPSIGPSVCGLSYGGDFSRGFSRVACGISFKKRIGHIRLVSNRFVDASFRLLFLLPWLISLA